MNKSKNNSLPNLDSIRDQRGMTPSRKISDGIKEALTYISVAIATLVLGAVFVYVFRRGASFLSWDLLSGDYNKTNYMVSLEDNKPGEFTAPDNLKEDEHFSEKFGIAVKDDVDASHNKLITVTYMDEKSPLKTAVNAISGPTKGEPQEIGRSDIDRIAYKDAEGKNGSAGKKARQTAAEMVEALDTKATEITTINYQSKGGGVRGSLISTLMVIGLTLLIALPIGIAAAIYLHELAPDNALTNFMRSSIEMLNAVPSIVFGLMGMVVLFPITAFFGATTPNLLLGSLTLVVVLFPVVIRQTEEALITVPDKLRMGSLALGATKVQTISKVVLPNALPGIITAALLSVSRIIGESAALIFTMGTFISDKPQITGRATTLAVHIWSVMSGEQPNFELASAISIIVLLMTLILNISVKVITNRLENRWKG